jgi:hypothetical protein
MKTRTLEIAGLAVLLASSAVAQLPHPLVAQVPFDFTVGKRTFQAGEYMVMPAGQGIVRLTSPDYREAMIAFYTPAQKSDRQAESKLVFNRYGDRYFLSQVWSAGSDTGLQLRKGAAEVEIARSIAKPVDQNVIARRR